MNDQAAQTFYETLGEDLRVRVVPGKDGISMNGHFTSEQLVLITHAYTTYLNGCSPVAEPEYVEEHEDEIRESTPDDARDEDEQRAY